MILLRLTGEPRSEIISEIGCGGFPIGESYCGFGPWENEGKSASWVRTEGTSRQISRIKRVHGLRARGRSVAYHGKYGGGRVTVYDILALMGRIQCA